MNRDCKHDATERDPVTGFEFCIDCGATTAIPAPKFHDVTRAEFLDTVVSSTGELRRAFLSRIDGYLEDVDDLPGIGALLGEHDGNVVVAVIERVLSLSVEERRVIFEGRS